MQTLMTSLLRFWLSATTSRINKNATDIQPVVQRVASCILGFMFKSRFSSKQIYQEVFNTFLRKFDKHFLRNYRWTTFIMCSAICGQFLLRMCRNGSKTTFGLKFHAIFEFSVSDFLSWDILKIGPRFQEFSPNFPLRMRRNGQKFYFR